MEFSNAFKEGGICVWSPDGALLATCISSKLTVRETSTLMVVNIFTNQDVVSQVEWSKDSKLILCAMHKRGVVQVWDVDDAEFQCKIGEGPAGLTYSRWAPDGRHIINTNDFNVRMTVWSLSTTAGVIASLRAPKFADKAAAFSGDGKFLAVAERKEGKDFIQIYNTSDWAPVQRFSVETKDLADLRFSPDDRVLGVWDSSLEYIFIAYSLEGRRLGRYQAYEGALGIKTVKWSPSSQFVSIGSFDGKARILNSLTWRPIQDFSHSSLVKPAEVLVYREQDLSGAVTEPIISTHGAHAVAKSSYELLQPSEAEQRISSTKPTPDKPNPKMGVGLMSWSADSSFVMTRNDNMPHALWIWDARQLQLLSTLVQLSPIKNAEWHPMDNRVAVCTGGRTIYLWSEEGASCIQVPIEGFSVCSLKWAPNGRALLLMDRDSLCVAFLAL